MALPARARLGTLAAIYGPMFAGKSTELVRRIRRYLVAKLNVFIIKSEGDLRSAVDKIETHGGDGMFCHVRVATMSEAIEQLKQHERDQNIRYDVVAIDEAQFFLDIFECASALADEGYTVITAGCESTFKRNAFGNYYKLVIRADEVIKLRAICMFCQAEASNTVQILPKSRSPRPDTEPQPGGGELYSPACRACYLQHENAQI